MNAAEGYKDFTARLKLLISKQPELITTTLGNIFTLRLIGNKTHGDLAEIAIAEFINQFMYDFRSIHVGKDLYRAKSQEEDIKVINEITKDEFPVSLKAYGVGPLQLSTDKTYSMFPRLMQEGGDIVGTDNTKKILDEPAFANFSNVNVLPLIYDEKVRRCNIMVFDYLRAREAAMRIVRERDQAGGENIRSTGFMMPKTTTFAKCATVMLPRTRFSAGFGRIPKGVSSSSTASRMAGSITPTISSSWSFFRMPLFRPPPVIQPRLIRSRKISIA